MGVRAKVLEFETRLDPSGTFSAGVGELSPPVGWSSEDLVLAGLIRCSLASLRYSATRAGIATGEMSGRARATVTRREEDGRYGFTAIDVELEAVLDPEPEPEALAELLAHAERGCFVGASLRPSPRYAWNVRAPSR
jgi:uncharacterized OsmC-like protein